MADAHGATQALGVSMGAGALLWLLAREPARFSRVVLLLPAALDGPRTDAAAPRTDAAALRVLDLAAALDVRDRQAVEGLVRREVLTGQDVALGVVEASVRARSGLLLTSPGVGAVLRSLPDGQPVEDRAPGSATCAARCSPWRWRATRCTGPGGPRAGRRAAAARPVVFDRPGVVVRERTRLRTLITGLGAPDDRA